MNLTRKVIPILLAIGLAATMTFVGVTPAGAQPSELWVDDDWAGSSPGDTVPVQSFGSIKLVKDAGSSEGIIYIDFTVTDAVLSQDGEYLYLSSKSDYKLYIVNLTDGSIDDISFDKMPESLTITPQRDAIYLALLTREHDYYWFGEQEGYIAEIDPDTRSLVREFWINEDPYDMVATSDGYLYVSPGSGQWDDIKGYDLATTTEVGSASIRHMSHIKPHPGENYIYAADTEQFPSDIEKFGISDGSIQALYDSPYHGDYPMCGDLEVSPDGTKIFTKCGHVFRSTEDQATDMTHIGTLGNRWNSLTLDEMNNIYTVDDTLLRKYDYGTYEQIWAKSIDGKGRFVFHRDGYLIVITEDGDFPTKSSIQIVDTTPTLEVWVDDDWAGSSPGDIVDGHMFGTDAFAIIQDGIDAVASPGTVHVAAGTYYENITLKDVQVLGAGADITTIDGSTARAGLPAYHVVVGADNAVLDRFTVTGANANGAGNDGSGGGMYNDNCSPTVTNCTFSGNSAGGHGGGMYNGHSSPTVTNCTFSGNSAEEHGGGMFNWYASPKVTNCAFSGNSASWGGGMYNEIASPRVTNCAFTNNSVSVNGGGMDNTESSPSVTNCTFSGNSSGNHGGGMCNGQSSPTVTNCTFSGNSATRPSGGMYNAYSSPMLTNCILWGDGWEIYNSISTPLVTYCDIQGEYSGVGNIDADPLFVDAAGGYYHLQAGSPCIDKGTNEGAPTEDIEGNPRPIDGDGDGSATTDMGAYEYVPPLEADFSADRTEVKVCEDVAFTSTVSGGLPPYGYAWDIGCDGSIEGTEEGLIWHCDAPGDYDVCLTVTDSHGNTDTETKLGYIHCEPALDADFEADVTQTKVCEDVAFSDLTTGGYPPYNYEWDFDNDGLVDSTGQNPSWHYEQAGLHSVSLKVLDSYGNTDTEIKEDYILVTGISCSDPNVTITDQDVTDDLASGLDVYDPANMPPDVTWEDAKGFYLEATGPDGCYEFFVRFETPVETGFTLYKLPAWTEIPYTIVEPDTIRVELCIVGGVLDPAFVLAGKAAPPPPPPAVGGEAFPPNKVAILAPWLALLAAILAGATIVLRRRRAQS